MLKTIGRILIILLAAGIVAGGVYALSQSMAGTGPDGFPGGPRDGQALASGALPGRGQFATDGSAPFARPGGDFGGPGRGREGGAQASLARGLAELLKNVVIVGILIGVISLVRYVTRRRPAQAAANTNP